MRNIAIIDFNEMNVIAYDALLNQRFIANARLHRIQDIEQLRGFCRTYPLGYVIIDPCAFNSSQDVTIAIELQSEFCEMMWLFYFSQVNPDLCRSVLKGRLDKLVLLTSRESKEDIEKGFDCFLQRAAFMVKYFSSLITTASQVFRLENKLLTQVETEILREIAFGKMTKEIAIERHVSMHTVVSHKKNIYKKLGINNVYDATKYAIKTGVITVNDYYI